ncbi:hypothetical protein ABZV81_30955 [Streptomyces parvus]
MSIDKDVSAGKEAQEPLEPRVGPVPEGDPEFRPTTIPPPGGERRRA